MSNLSKSTYAENIYYFIFSKTIIILTYGIFINFQGNTNKTHNNKFNIFQTEIYEGIHVQEQLHNKETKYSYFS